MAKRTALIWLLAIGGLALAVLASMLFHGNYAILKVAAGSMEPTYCQNDLLVLRKVESGDPIDWLEPNIDMPVIFMMNNKLAVKRLVGLPGDKIVVESHSLLRNGASIADFMQCPAAPGLEMASEGSFDLIVPPRYIYLLGDNYGASIDSRQVGAQPVVASVGVPIAHLAFPGRKCTCDK